MSNNPQLIEMLLRALVDMVTKKVIKSSITSTIDKKFDLNLFSGRHKFVSQCARFSYGIRRQELHGQASLHETTHQTV